MPCRDHWDDNYNSRTIEDLQKRNDELAQMLCGICTSYEYVKENDFRDAKKIDCIYSTPGLQEWWDDHKEADRKRIEIEKEKERKQRIKQQALSKLTNEERLLLGLSAK